MRFLRSGKYLAFLWQSSLLAGLLVLPVGCDRTDASASHALVARSESAVQKQALSAVATPTTATATPNPAAPGRDGLDDLKQVLARKFDPSQMLTRPASPQGGTLHIPNGHVAHAAILVKNPDGTLRRACVSSSAEVSALGDQLRQGGGQ